MEIPFYQKVRPDSLEDMVGQKHILSEGMIIDKLYKQKKITNIIMYGPPGTGKTTLANILMNNSGLKSYKLNATYSKTQDIRDITSQLEGFNKNTTVIIFVDEIQNFNKKQQQLLLEYIEYGNVILIANTTENPYHHIYKSLLSRCSLIEFKNISDIEIRDGLIKCIKKQTDIDIVYTEEDLDSIVRASNGDFRKSLNVLGLLIEFYSLSNKLIISKENIKQVCMSKVIEYDRNSDSHYDLLSAFQKSIRGSDPDAAIHYLARLVHAQDIDSICRRLLVIASEDVGLAYPQAVSIVKSCIDSAYMIGFPEARIPLAQATILLSISPKSNASYMAIDIALKDIVENNINDIPSYLRDSHYSGFENLYPESSYKYPHNYEKSYIDQQYLPDSIKDTVYYHPGNNKFENNALDFLKKLKV